ncbi:geranylgeranyl pyrophosphate synthetase, partial [Physocladia obscura]
MLHMKTPANRKRLIEEENNENPQSLSQRQENNLASASDSAPETKSTNRVSYSTSSQSSTNIPIAIASILPETQSFAANNTDLETWRAAQQRILLEPFVYLTQQRGKEIRSKLISAFDFWLRVPPAKLKVISEIVEMLHTASLLIDDVQDNSELRRGIPVAHKIYGIASAINSGNYVYFLALKKASTLAIPEILDIFSDELINLHKGQGMEIHWRDNAICPTEAEYLQMVSNKTGGLLRLAVRMMQAASSVKDGNFVHLVDKLGIHFQMRDDYLNLVSQE